MRSIPLRVRGAKHATQGEVGQSDCVVLGAATGHKAYKRGRYLLAAAPAHVLGGLLPS